MELAILDGLTDAEIRSALSELDADLPDNLDERPTGELVTLARRLLKKRGGLHAQFLDALPAGRHPILARSVLEQALDAGARRARGLIQL